MVTVGDRVLLRDFSCCEFVHEAVGDSGHIVAGIFLREKLFDLCGHVFHPSLQRLPLIERERFEDLLRVPSPLPEFVSSCGREMFHDGVFHSVGDRTMAITGVVKRSTLLCQCAPSLVRVGFPCGGRCETAMTASAVFAESRSKCAPTLVSNSFARLLASMMSCSSLDARSLKPWMFVSSERIVPCAVSVTRAA